MRPQDGIIQAGNDYFAWLATVPSSVKAKIKQNGTKTLLEGDGYHDHNWGNTSPKTI